MLAKTVDSYLALRRASGFNLRSQGGLLRTFATFSDTKGKHYVCSATAIEWAGSMSSVFQRARRLDEVIRFARYMHARGSHGMKYRRLFLAARHDGGPFLLSFPRTISGALFKPHLSLDLPACADIPTVRFSPCCHAQASVYRKRSGSAWMTSLQMVW